MRQRIASAAHVRANGLASADDFVRAYSEPYYKPDNIANAHPAAYLPTELPALAGALACSDHPAKFSPDVAANGSPDAAPKPGPDAPAEPDTDVPTKSAANAAPDTAAKLAADIPANSGALAAADGSADAAGHLRGQRWGRADGRVGDR